MPYQQPKIAFTQLKYALLLCLCLTLQPVIANIPSPSTEAINAYKHTLTLIDKGKLSEARPFIEGLHTFPLQPYLQKAWLIKNINNITPHMAQSFLASEGDTVAAQQFRKSWLEYLADKNRWQDFIRFYHHQQATQELKCHYAEALHQQGSKQASMLTTNELWLNGSSLPEACNKALIRWQRSELNTENAIWQRVKLALNKSNYGLIGYIKKKANKVLARDIDNLLKTYRQPKKLINTSVIDDIHPLRRKDHVLFNLNRLANNDVELAILLWPEYRQLLSFDEQEQEQIQQSIARNLIASGKDSAMNWLIKNDPNGTDQFLLEWRILLAIRLQQWHNAERWISLLPDNIRSKAQWQYWLARVQLKLNPTHLEAKQQLAELADTRHYYGFLAANYLQLPYKLNQKSLPSNLTNNKVNEVKAIQRAKVFYQMGEIIAARREWYSAAKDFNQEQKAHASLLAHQWGWHQQAILTSTQSNFKDDLNLRFPLAYSQNIMASAKLTDLEAPWLYAITRQESAFATDAQSTVGAKGLMQLRPSTAKQAAKLANIKFRSRDIFKADTNILLGSHYLQELFVRFNGNRILATAAYNAGPQRVKRWLEKQDVEMDYDIWIDTLPYYETRNYIKNVLASALIYSHRLGQDVELVNESETLISQRLLSN